MPIPARAVDEAMSGSQIVLRVEKCVFDVSCFFVFFFVLLKHALVRFTTNYEKNSALANMMLGPINEFKTFCDINKETIKQRMRSELQCSNVSIVDATTVTKRKVNCI